MRGISENTSLAQSQLKEQASSRGVEMPRSVQRRMSMNTNIAPTPPLNHRAAKQVTISAWKEESMDILIRADGVELTDKLRETSPSIGNARLNGETNIYDS